MAMVPGNRLLLAEELLLLPDDGSVSHELIEGTLVRVTPSAWLPGVVSGNIFGEMRHYVRQHQLGICGTAESGFLLRRQPDTVRAPDAWFVGADRIPDAETGGEFFPGYPDLAVEVLSPSDRFGDVVRKAREYLTLGTRLVWVIDPMGHIAAIFYPNGSARLLGDNDTLDGEDVLPGFSVTLQSLLELT